MKNLLKTFSLFAACSAMIFMYSCDQDDTDGIEQEQGGIEFLFTGDRVSNGDTGNKVGDGKSDDAKDGEFCDLALASYAVIEMSGISYTIDLKEWGDNIKTNLIELDPGTYEVTSCQLYDADDNPLYATPTTGSEFGPFVTQSLPFEVTVENFRKIEYDLEVLCVEEFTPPQFGFVFWDITIKEVKNLCVFANFCDPEDGHEVATLEAFIYPNENETTESDLIWSGSADGDFNSGDESNELLCLKFPYDPSLPTEDQSFFIELFVNGVPFQGTMPLDRVDMINDEKGYLHLNENCDGDFDVFSNSYNIAWEDLNDNDGGNDCDYNDFIINTTTSTDIITGSLNFKFEPMARGGGYAHAFKFWLPGTGYVISGDFDSVTEISGNTEVVVFSNTNQAFTPNQNFINTKCNGVVGSGIVKNISIDVAPTDFTFYLLNPFDANLNVTGGGSNYDLTIGNLFAPSTFIKDGQVMRNGLITDMNWNWVKEGIDIRTVYGTNFETNFVPVNNTQDLYVNCP
jgi:hypothetical protein